MSHPRASLRVLALGLWIVGCGGGGSEPSEAADRRSVGTLALQLTLPDMEVGDLEYTVTRAGAIKRSGIFVVEGFRGTFRAVLGGLPPADDYRLDLTGTAREVATREVIDCAGFAAFGVTPKQTTGISLRLYCGEEPPPISGGLAPPMGGQRGECPEVEVIHASPMYALVGGELKLTAEVSHLDRVPAVIYAWSSDVGTFTQALGGQATFKCTEPGSATITLDISFSDGERTCPKRSGSVEVMCRSASADVSGTGGAGTRATAGRSGGASGAAEP